MDPSIPKSEPQSVDDDGRLIDDLLRGDSAAFAGVRRWIRGAATPYRGALHQDLEDLEQTVVLSLLETLRAGAFEGRSRLETYVRRMMVYRCINRMRDLRQRERVSLDDLELVSAAPGAERRSSDRQSLRVAVRVQADLSDRCRQIFRLLLEGLDRRAIAERLQITTGNLRVRLLRCRRALLAAWREQTGEDL